VNADTLPYQTVTMQLLGPQGQRNQFGRIVQLHPLDIADAPVLTRIVDSGSGYMAQRDDRLLFTGVGSGRRLAKAYLIEGEGDQALSVRLDFEVESGHHYTVTSATAGQAAVVWDDTSGRSVPYSRTYASTIGDDTLTLAAPGGAAHVALWEGDDVLTLETPALNAWVGSRVEGGNGDDVLEIAGSSGYTAGLVTMQGGAGNDVLRAALGTGTT
jgi:hypothetical protein